VRRTLLGLSACTALVVLSGVEGAGAERLARPDPVAATAASGPSVVGCYRYTPNGHLVDRQRPGRCLFLAQGALPTATTTVNVMGMRWRGWGDAQATATGVVVDAKGARTKVRVRLGGLRRCTTGHTEASSYHSVTVTARATGRRVFRRSLSFSCA
jgi:hypothetical protein